ncbi:MAG: NDP-sugar synthase [Thermodesulfobacteriota bacterium]
MKAMILAAGFGTRLRPLTLLKPKPLFPVLNKPLLAIIIEQLRHAGVTEIAVNTHHLGDQIAAFLEKYNLPGFTVHVLHERLILGTGGGLRNAGRFLDNAPFLVVNGDIFTTIDLKAAYTFHIASGNAVTMALHHYPKYNNVLVDDRDFIKGFSPRPDGRMAFTGIHVINPDVLSLIPKGVYYDILDTYRTLISKGAKVGAFRVSGHYWTDIGTTEAYLALHGDLLKGQVKGIDDLLPCDSPFCLGEDVSIGKDVEFIDWVSLGDRVSVGPHAHLTRSIIWEGASIKANSRIVNAVAHGVFPQD